MQKPETVASTSGIKVEVTDPKAYKNEAEVSSKKKCKLKQNVVEVKLVEVNCKITSPGDNIDSKSLTCIICDKSFKKNAYLRRHMQVVHAAVNDTVECNICFKTFRTKIHLRGHIKIVHTEATEELKCNKCGKVFINKLRLKNHLYICHPEGNEKCMVCQKDFKSKHHLKLHMDKVHPPIDQSVNCDQCGKTFKHMVLLKRHVKWNHPEDDLVYRCPHCGRTLPSLNCLQAHITNVHSSSEPQQCDICKKSLKNKKCLVGHMKALHGEGLNVKIKHQAGDLPCKYCKKKFQYKTGLSWHIERCHSNDSSETNKLKSCPICFKELKESGMSRHLDTHKTEMIPCHVCEKPFRSHTHLQHHMRTTHPSPEAAVVCDICKKTYKCAQHLTIHKHSVHANEGPFTCDLCKKKFTSKKYFTKHMKSHDDTRNFPCEYCNKYFKSLYNVRKHIKKVHDKPEVVEELNEYSEEELRATHDEQGKNSQELSGKQHNHQDKTISNCFKCKEYFSSSELLQSHVLTCSIITACKLEPIENKQNEC